jgi:hypothetical protein
MNIRGIIIPGFMGVLIIAIVVGVVLYGARDESNGPGQTKSAEPITSFTGTAGGILREGQNITCSVTRNDAAGSVTGTVYVAGVGKRLRGDFVSTRSNGSKVNGHVVLAGGKSYFWTDELPQGTITLLDEQGEAGAQENEQNAFEENVEYNCQPWSVETSVFVLPTNKELIERTQP